MSKPVSERRKKLLEQNVTNIKLCACVEDIKTHVSKLNQQLESLSNPVPEVLNQQEPRKELVSLEGNETESDDPYPDEEEDDYVYDFA